MDVTGMTDLFATKGIEYLIVIGYLVLLVLFWGVLTGPRAARSSATTTRGAARPRTRLTVPNDHYYHPGHAWAVATDDRGIMKVGMDDFAQRLLGTPDAVRLPAVGARLKQGDHGWNVVVDSEEIGMRSPVAGEVIEINPDAVASPAVVCDDPYDRGWLMRVRVGKPNGMLKNLLRGDAARAWMDQSLERLITMQSGELGVMMPDGGMPVSGLARAVAPTRWPDVAREFLLS